MTLLAVAALCLALLVPGLDAAVMLDSSLQVGLNSVLQLTCTATSSLTVRGFSWKLNGAEIDVGDSRYIPTQTDNVGRLQIFNVEYADAGRYLCTAEYSDGTKENSTEREVMVVTVPVIQATTPVYTEDRTVHLSCSVNTSATLQWIFNGTVILNEGRYSIMYTETKRNITLVIDTVTAQDAGEYVCRAANSVGSDHTTVVLKVPSPPVLEPLNSTMSFPKGSNFNLTCCTKVLLPLPKLVWTVNGSDVMTTLANSVMVVEETASVLTLVVKAATFDPRGTYTCTATNSLGMDTVSTEVTITGPPDVSVTPTQSSVGRGGSVSFNCVAFAVPPITSIVWKGPSGSPLSNTVGDKYRVNGRTLTVTALSSNDSGNYSCVAGNSEGDTNGTANLVVLDLPPAPSNVTISSDIGQRNVTLQWTKPTDVSPNQIIEYYVIKYQLPGNTETKEATVVSSDLSSFEVTNLLPGTTHTVWVVSRNAAGDSPDSNTVSVTTEPSAPSISTFTATSLVSGRQVLLKWVIEYDGGASITRYTLEYRRGDSEIWLHVNATVDVYSGAHCVSGLSPETPYSFRLSFQNEHGTSEHMHTQATTSLGVPGKPSRPIVSDPSPTSVSARVFFTDLGSGDLQGLSANITQTSSGQTHTQYLQVPAGQQVYQMVLVEITGLLPNTQYSFEVAGVNAVGTGEFSDESEPITTGADNSMYYIIAASVGGFILLLLLLCCVAVIVACCCRSQHGAFDTKGATERLAISSSPTFREPLPSRSAMGLEVSPNPMPWRLNSRLSDHISPFSHDTMPKEPPPYPLPPPLLESDNRFTSNSTSQLPTQFHSLFELKHVPLERDDSEWYLKGCSQPDSAYPRGSDDVPNALHFSTDV